VPGDKEKLQNTIRKQKTRSCQFSKVLLSIAHIHQEEIGDSRGAELPEQVKLLLLLLLLLLL
jgi:hypothetical protein